MNRFRAEPRQRRQGKAVACSSGIVIGRVRKLLHGRRPIVERAIERDRIENEVGRLEHAITAAGAAIDVEREHLMEAGVNDPLMVLDMYRMLIADPDLQAKTVSRIRSDCMNAEWALRQEIDEIRRMFEQIEDAYLRSRSSDIEHAGERILDHLLGTDGQQAMVADEQDNEPLICVSDDCPVADVVSMWRQGVAGIITEQGGVDAHNIIVARGIGLPAMVGAAGILSDLEDGERLILDAEQNLWIANPSDSEAAAYEKFRDAISISKRGLEAYAAKPSLSADGHELKLMANIEFSEELEMADHIGIDGIGLYRSEFLFINEPSMPGEDAQAEQYGRLVRRMNGKPVVMRLLDIGGDRPWLYSDLAGHEYSGANPALGLRGARLLLNNPDLLQCQISAMLRAADEGPVRILVPMVTTCEEMEQIRDVAEGCRKRLGTLPEVPIGAMIEVPAAALIADQLAGVSDFFSIGTNDLMQYTLAADRNDEEVAYFYSIDHAAIRTLIRNAAAAAKQHHIPISVCGELAANPEWTELFLNLDMEYLSMSSGNILSIRRFLSRQHYTPIL